MRDKLEDDVTPANTSHTPVLLVREIPDQGKRDRTRYTVKTIPQCSDQSNRTTGRGSITAAGLSTDTTAASSNTTSDSVSQLHSKPRRQYISWSGKILKTMLTLILLLDLVMKAEGIMDWRESPFSMQAFDCTTPHDDQQAAPARGLFHPEEEDGREASGNA